MYRIYSTKEAQLLVYAGVHAMVLVSDIHEQNLWINSISRHEKYTSLLRRFQWLQDFMLFLKQLGLTSTGIGHLGFLVLVPLI